MVDGSWGLTIAGIARRDASLLLSGSGPAVLQNSQANGFCGSTVIQTNSSLRALLLRNACRYGRET